MTPVINPWLIYLIGIADGLKYGALALGVLLFIYIFGNAMSGIKSARWCYLVATLGLVLAMLVPSSNTVTAMTVAQNVTYERVDVAADTVREVYEDIMALFEED